jgi:anti-anti-sigma factor
LELSFGSGRYFEKRKFIFPVISGIESTGQRGRWFGYASKNNLELRRSVMGIVAKERQAGGEVVLELSGRLYLGESSEELDAKLQSLFAAGKVNLILDCSGVTAIDSQGIKVLVRAVISAHTRGGKVALLKISHRVREVLTITHLLSVIESFDDEPAALASFPS